MIGLLIVLVYIVAMTALVVVAGWKRDGVPPWRREFWT